jgi:hypothetical protein
VELLGCLRRRGTDLGSRLNMVEIFFGIITRQAIRRLVAILTVLLWQPRV